MGNDEEKEFRDDPPKLNRDLTEANRKRTQNADEFARKVMDTLSLIEKKEGKKFKSLGGRVEALNHHEDGIPPRRGKVWTKTGMRNLLKRWKRPNKVLTGPLDNFFGD